MQVLLVEDDTKLSFMVKKRLEHLNVGIEVVVVGCLKAALKWLATAKPDVVLLDLNLPDSGGIATFDRVAEHAMATPIVVASATGDRNVPRIAIQRGAYDYIEKGKFDPLEVCARLVNAVEAHAVQHQKKIQILTKMRSDTDELKNPEDSAKNRLATVRSIASGFQRMAETDAS
jgi:DNA-binding response OmpR family regulator